MAPILRQRDRREAAQAALEDYIALCQACGYTRGVARGYMLLGRFLFFNPDWRQELERGQTMFERAVAVCEANGLHDLIVYPQAHLAGTLALFTSDMDRAESLIDACLPQAQAQQDTTLLRYIFTTRMWIAARRADREALQAALRESLAFGGPPNLLMLSHFEDISHQRGASATFLDLCRSMAEEYARAGLEAPIQFWYLRSASARPLPGEPWLREEFGAEEWHPLLQWQDATGRSRLDRTTRPGWLGLYPPQGANLWPREDLNAPRLWATVQGSYIAQVRLELGTNVTVLAGLLVWRDEEHFARLELQMRDLVWERPSVHLEACVAGEYQIVGRGQCDRQAMWLRAERVGDEVRGLCSPDGEEWLECGSVRLPAGGTEQVGLAAIWFGPGAHVWFDTFLLWRGGQ